MTRPRMAVLASDLGRAAVRRVPRAARTAPHDRRAAEAVDNALRMLFALSSRALLMHLLIGRREADEEAERAGRIPGMRLLAWIVVGCIAGALLAGYARFAPSLRGRVVFTVTLVATLYLLLDRHRRGDRTARCRRTRPAAASSRASSASSRAGSA